MHGFTMNIIRTLCEVSYDKVRHGTDQDTTFIQAKYDLYDVDKTIVRSIRSVYVFSGIITPSYTSKGTIKLK